MADKDKRTRIRHFEKEVPHGQDQWSLKEATLGLQVHSGLTFDNNGNFLTDNAGKTHTYDA
jgi:hypothetical protein